MIVVECKWRRRAPVGGDFLLFWCSSSTTHDPNYWTASSRIVSKDPAKLKLLPESKTNLLARRGGASAREDEPRRDDQAEQQAPAPRGPVLPPPPPVNYRVFMQGLVQAMQTQAHTQAALQAQLEAQEGEMEQYLEEKKASQKRPVATFQRQDKKKTVYQTPQKPMTVSNSQVPSVRSPGVKKECPHCGKTHGGSECWLVACRCLKCGSSDHKIKECPRLQQGAQHGTPAPAIAAAAPPTGRPGRP
ncbi:hypothetical protein Taro_010502 [Colocasia esculenta]|uniref:CCHC-type domain-containing protein n=1 Tax=Colocasia esculenta TaxID=4460 RepID=A0A843U7V2_COLES|nr:hypothetical protein [Colocasia esculenta]